MQSRTEYPTVGKQDIEQYCSLFPSLKTNEHIYINCMKKCDQCNCIDGTCIHQVFQYEKNLNGLLQLVEELESISLQLHSCIEQNDINKSIELKEQFNLKTNEESKLLCELINNNTLKIQLLNDLSYKMNEYSKNQQFENAAIIRDVKNTIETIQETHFNDKEKIDRITKRLAQSLMKK
ncbi:hypothetical protein WA158_008216 [Blastocystis sp. Blastoise]